MAVLVGFRTAEDADGLRIQLFREHGERGLHAVHALTEDEGDVEQGLDLRVESTAQSRRRLRCKVLVFWPR